MYYTTKCKRFRRFKNLETRYKDLLSEIPPFDPEKVTFKRKRGVWLDETTDGYKEMIKELSSTTEWVEGCNSDSTWYNFPLILKDQPIGFAKEICPVTIGILQAIGGINVAGFAILRPHSILPVHTDVTGPTYGSMAFNMLISGEKSSLIVGKSAPYIHKLGKAVLFNSEIPHCARNDSDDNRVILYMDIVQLGEL